MESNQCEEEIVIKLKFFLLSPAAAQDGSFSVTDRTLTPTEPNMTDSPEEQSYVLPEVICPPSYVKTFGQLDAKVRK